MDHCALYILSCETKDFKIIRLYVNFILVNPCIPTIRPFLSDEYTPVFLILNLRYNTKYPIACSNDQTELAI